MVEFFRKSTDDANRESIKGFLWITGLGSLGVYLVALLPIYLRVYNSNRHFALPRLLANRSLLSKVLEYLPLVEVIFESEENIEIFSQVANRLDTFRIADEYEDWDNIESFIKDVRERNGFDN